MAELPGLEELLLSGYDVSALLTGAQAQASGQGLGVLGLEAQLQLKAQALPQHGLGWPSVSSTDQTDLYQKVAQSLAAKLEEHRLQQVQVATALQQLQALQQQQELAQLQQQLNALHQHVPRASNPFQRSRTTDLESLGRGPSFDVAAAYSSAIEYEQQKHMAALQQAANPTTQLIGLQRMPGVIGQHNLPVRSFSSEQLVAGQRRSPPQLLQNATGQQTLSAMAASKRPPIRQPSGLGPNGRGGQGGARTDGQGGGGGRRARYAATAKAPSWASEDWHPMKAVIASGAHASGGTGVFLPHLAGASGSASAGGGGSTSSSAVNSSGGTAAGGAGGSAASGVGSGSAGGAAGSGGKGSGGDHRSGNNTASSIGSGGSGQASSERGASVLDNMVVGPNPQAQTNSSNGLVPNAGSLVYVPSGVAPPGSSLLSYHHLSQHQQQHLVAAAAAAAAAGLGSLALPQRPSHPPQRQSSQTGSSSLSPSSPPRGDTASVSPPCSVDSNGPLCCSAVATDPYSRQTTLELSRGSTYSELDSHPTSSFGYLVDTMKVVVEEPEREHEDANEECDFVALARELADLMNKQAM